MRRGKKRHWTPDVRVGPGIVREAISFSEQYERRFLLSDTNVGPLHAGKLGTHRTTRFDVPAGEASKSFATLERVLDAMVVAGCDRKSGLIALGGGVIGDLGGLAAALYMRGIDVVQVPTSLLAMVDASIGGKTAVNLSGGKNLAGAFHMPRAVYADTELLATLPDAEFRSGLGEVVKAAIIDGDLLDELDAQSDAILRRDPEVVAGVVRACVNIKDAVVARDPYDEGQRRVLNLGHTFAHAIEHQAGTGSVPHGVAVGVGVWLAIELSTRAGMLAGEDLQPRVAGLLETFGLPRTLGGLVRAGYADAGKLDAAGILAAMKRDKKGAGGKHHLVLPLGGGSIHPDVPVEPELIRPVLEASLAE